MTPPDAFDSGADTGAPDTTTKPTEARETAEAAAPTLVEPSAEALHLSKAARGDWVRGGTTSAAHDANEAALRADAEKRRAVQDSFFEGARVNPHEARLHSLRLFSRDQNASIVLAIVDPRTAEPAGWITCELTAEVGSNNEPDLILVIACPACHARHGTMSAAQVTLRQSHTKFTLDTRRQGEIWVNPVDPDEKVRLAGTVTMSRWAKCPGLGCPMHFMIDESELYMERR